MLFIHSFLFICLYVQFILIFMKYEFGSIYMVHWMTFVNCFGAIYTLPCTVLLTRVYTFEVQGVLFNLWLSEMFAISSSGWVSAFTRLCGKVCFYETVDALLFIAVNIHINGRFHRHNGFWRSTVKTFSEHILVITQHPTM